MVPTPQGIFEEIFRKKDHRFKLWLYQAEYQLRMRKCHISAKYITAGDIVFNIINGVLTGTIQWNMEKVPNVTTFMFNQIRSQVANYSKKGCGKYVLNELTGDCKPKPAAVITDIDELMEESLQDIYNEMDILELRELMLEHLVKDPIAYFVYDETLSGKQNTDIAKSLKLSIGEVEAAKKRIRTVLRKLVVTME